VIYSLAVNTVNGNVYLATSTEKLVIVDSNGDNAVYKDTNLNIGSPYSFAINNSGTVYMGGTGYTTSYILIIPQSIKYANPILQQDSNLVITNNGLQLITASTISVLVSYVE
jgi:hypothetical protein